MSMGRDYILRFYELLDNKSIYNKIKEFDARDFEKEAEVRQYQLKKLKHLIKYATDNVPYYIERKEIYNKSFDSLDDLKNLPFLTKEDIINNFEQLTIQNKNKKVFRINTGGSTGQPTPFEWTKEQKEYNNAAAFKNFRMVGWNFMDKTILMTASPTDINKHSRIVKNLKNKLKREVVIPMFGKSTDDFQDIYDFISKYKPKVIIGFVSSMFCFCDWLINEKQVPLKIPIIIQAAEKVEDYQKTVIEKGFGGKFYKHYGAREINGIGIECMFRNGLHVNESNLIVEILKNNKDCQNNEEGEIVITDLNSFGMPLIRYKIGDIGMKFSNECECGRNSYLFDITQGRISDILTTPDNKFVTAAFFPHLFKDFVSYVEKYQVHQIAINRVILRIVRKDGYSDTTERDLDKSLKSVLGNSMIIEYQYQDKIETELSGKFRVVKSDVKVSYGND